MDVLAVAGDAGGAQALLPVVEALRRAGHRVRCHAYRAALSLWTQRGLEPSAVRPEVTDGRLLLGTTMAEEAWELGLIEDARRRGVPAVSVLDFWGHYRERFSRAGGLVLPDAIAVMDGRALREMVALGFPAEALHVTGQPAFDALATYDTPEARSAARERVRQQTGGGAERTILYVSQPLSELFGREKLGFLESDVLAGITSSLAEVAARRRCALGLLVKRHPREAGTPLSLPASPSANLAIGAIPDEDPTDRHEWVIGCDLVVGMSSILLMEAALLRRPVVSVQPGLRTADTLPSNAMGWSRAVYDSADLSAILEAEMFDPRTQEERERRLAAIERPSGATDRVIALLEGLAP